MFNFRRAPKRKAAAAAASPPTDPPAAVAEDGAPLAQDQPKSKRAAKAKEPPAPPGPVYDPETMRQPRLVPGSTDNNPFTILSWNVAGLRALFKKTPDALKLLVDAESPDVLCLQEHKLQDGKHCEDAAAALAEHLPGWSVHWNCSTEKKGYSGTAVISRTPPLSVEYGIGIDEHDGEGRVIAAEFDKLFVVTV